MERLYQKRLSSLCLLPSSVSTSFFPQEIYSNRRPRGRVRERPPADRHTPTKYRPTSDRRRTGHRPPDIRRTGGRIDGEMELDPDTQFGEESKCINHLSASPNIRIIFLACFLVESSTSCGYFGSTDGSGCLYYVYSMFTSIQPSLRCSSDPQLGNFGHFSTSIGHNFLCRRRLRDRPSSRPPSSFPLGKSQMGFLVSWPAVL